MSIVLCCACKIGVHITDILHAAFLVSQAVSLTGTHRVLLSARRGGGARAQTEVTNSPRLVGSTGRRQLQGL